tara:strand:- start:11985 stop:13583 length:1599 start_codon:yes stop_codon:yes gene_type:complete
MILLVDLKRIYTPSTAATRISSLEDVIGSLLDKNDVDLSIEVGDLASEDYLRVITEKYADNERCPLVFISELLMHVKFSDEILEKFLSKLKSEYSEDQVFSVIISNLFIASRLNLFSKQLKLLLTKLDFIDYPLITVFVEFDDYYRKGEIHSIEECINSQEPGGVLQCGLVSYALLSNNYFNAYIEFNDWFELLDRKPFRFCSTVSAYISTANSGSSSDAFRLLNRNPLCLFAMSLFQLKVKTGSLADIELLNGQLIDIRTSAMPVIAHKIDYTVRVLQQYLKDKPAELTFITSMFKGDDWIDGFLDNMTSLIEFDKSVLLLFDANSPGNELSRSQHYLNRFTNIVYVKLDFDPGLYDIWNIGCASANSEFISNANLDDRKALDFIPGHLSNFEEKVSLVSSPVYISKVPDRRPEGIDLDNCESLAFYDSSLYYGYQDFFVKYHDGRVVVRNIPHCMPVWRKCLHQKFGYFNENCGGPTADFEFWIRCASKGEVYKNTSRPLGVYYYSDVTTYSARQANTLDEIIEKYIRNN